MKNQHGYSLVELMMILALMGLTGAGTIVFMMNVASSTKTTSSKASLLSLKTRFENLLINRESWRETVHAAANTTTLGCLRSDTTPANYCVHGTTVNNFILMNPGPTSLSQGCPATATDYECLDGTVFFDDSLDQNGFTLEGEPCSSFNNPASDECPLTINLSADFACAYNRPTCRKPQVTINITLDFEPGSESSLGNRIDFSRLNNRLDLNQYMRFEYFEVKYYANQGGACPAFDSWSTRPLNLIVEDSGDNIIGNVRGAPDYDIHVRAGTYDCDVVAEAHGLNNGVRVRLVNKTDSLYYPIGTGQSNASIHIRGGATIVANNDFYLGLENYCETPSPPGSSTDQMGRPKLDSGGNAHGNPFTSYSGDTYTNIKCVRNN